MTTLALERVATIVIDWLERNPIELDTILTLATLPLTASSLDFEAKTEAEMIVVGARKRAVERYFGSAMFGACASCYLPVVEFSDGRAMNWPDMGEHAHEFPAELPAPMARRARGIAS